MASTRDPNLSDSTVTPAASTSPWDSLRHPIWLFDPETCRGLYANPPAIALWDAETLDELLARDFSKLSPAVRTRTERLARATANGEALTERWTFYPKGQPVTVQAVISTYVQAGGRSVLLFEATPIDVEDGERRAVEALRHTSSLITLFTPDGKPVFSNPAAIATYGDGVTFCDRFYDQDYGYSVLEAVLADEIIAELVEVISILGTRSHHIDARQVLDPVTGEISVLLSERDVTAQVEAERALLIAEERAAVAVAKEQFLANVSHELRTPLTSVLGYSDLLKREPGISPTALNRLSLISDAGKALLEIVNNLITLTEIDNNEINVRQEKFCVDTLLQSVFEDVRPATSQKALELRLQDSEVQELWAIGDAEKLGRILLIFLSNAIKYTDAGEVTLGAKILENDGNNLILEFFVRDTGRGIPPDAHDLIFDRFRQADQTRIRTGGSGLGLAIARRLADVLGGSIGLASSEGEGSTFHLQLRLEATASVVAIETGRAESISSLAPSILYADDHENNRALVSAILHSQGYECDLAEDGRQALAAAIKKSYDLILMDIQMPVMDGVTATRHIRQILDYDRTPIIAVTANTQSREVEEYIKAGMNVVIEKPIVMHELLRTLHAQLLPRNQKK